MKFILRLSGATTFILILSFVAVPSAYGYLDPGTGSYMLQIILAVVLGALLSLKIFWSRVLSTIKGIFRKKDK